MAGSIEDKATPEIAKAVEINMLVKSAHAIVGCFSSPSPLICGAMEVMSGINQIAFVDVVGKSLTAILD